MAATLTGFVKSMREVEGVSEKGRRQGERWQFLSFDITDFPYGNIWSCQLRQDEEQYSSLVGGDLVGHKVKVTIKSQSASPRTLANGREVMQIRSQITNVRDLGLAQEEE